MKKNLLKALSLCITLCMILTTVLMTPVSAWTEGSGELPDDFTYLFDYRIRDTNIFYVPATDKLSGDTIEGGDMYYMVGTTEGKYGSDDYWTSNEGIRMWKSKDMVTWESVFGDGNEDNYSEDAEDQNDSPDNYVWKKKDSSWAENRGPVWAPEIHYIYDTDTLEGNYYMTYSMGGSAPGSTCQVTQGDHMSDPLNFECQHNGNGLLRSTTGRPEGPYEEVKDGPIVSPWIDGALFQDVENGGTVYYIWQNGQIAQMNDTMTDILPETYAHLKTTNNSTVNQQVGFEGASVVYYEGKYYLYAADNNADLGKFYTYDCMVASSDNLFGPYSERYLAIRHGGHNNFFVNREGELWSTFFGNPQAAIQPPFTARPGALEMILDSQGMLTPKLDINPPRRIDLAKGKTVKASSGNDSASRAVDNDAGLLWFANDNEKSWLVVDLGVSYNLTGVKLFFQHESAQYYYSIETADDPAAWENPENADLWSSYIDHMASGTLGLHAEDASAVARYVKITIDDTNNRLSTYVGAIRDFEVYGLPIGESAAEIAEYALLSNVASGQTTLTMPLVPEGYTVSIKETDRPDIIATDGTVTPGALTTIVNVTLTITNIDDPSDTADTAPLSVKVAPDSSANLAKDKTASASGVYDNTGNYTADKAVDGDMNTSWAAPWPYGVHELIVDLGSSYSVQEVRILSDVNEAPNTVRAVTVSVSEDNKVWTALAGENTKPGLEVNVTSSGVSGRYVKLSFNWTGVTAFPKIAEVEIYGTTASEVPCDHVNTEIQNVIAPTCTKTGYTGDTVCTDCRRAIAEGEVSPATGHNYADGACVNCGELYLDDTLPNLALGKPATATGVYDPTYTADKAFDGNTSTCWAAPWALGVFDVVVDLQSKATINGVKVIRAAEEPGLVLAVTVYVSEDGETWTALAEENTKTDYEIIVAGNSANARYVKMSFVKADAGQEYNGKVYQANTAFPKIAEVEVYGTAEGGDVTAPCEHANTGVQNVTDATCTEDGYTGDTVCLDCGETLAEGEVIKANGHSYVDGACTNCGEADPDYVPEEPETKINIALGKNVTAKVAEIIASYEIWDIQIGDDAVYHQDPALVAANAVDGDMNTVWAAPWARGVYDFTIDLGEVYPVKEIKLSFPENVDGYHAVTAYVSPDNENWTQFAPKFYDVGGEVVFPNGDLHARYVKLTFLFLEAGTVYNGVTYENEANFPKVSEIEIYACTHTSTDVQNKADATCTADGYTGDTVCLDCRETLAEGEVIEANGHSYVDGACANCGEADPDAACEHTNTEVQNKADATCTEEGYTGDTVCLDCGETVAEGKVIPANGHSYESGVCTTCGALYETVVEIDGALYYVKDGALTNYNGLKTMSDGVKYVFANGVVRTDFTGVHKHGDGRLYYIENGKFRAYNGLKTMPDGAKYLLNWGVVRVDFTGIHEHAGKLYYIVEGKFNAYNGLKTMPSGAKYLLNWGVVRTDFTGLHTHAGLKYYIVEGKFNAHNGLKTINGIKYVLNKGVLNTSVTGYHVHAGVSYYVVNGVAMTGLKEVDGVKYLFNNGLVNTAFTGYYTHGTKDFYLVKGVAANGVVVVNGVTCTFKNGVLIG